jgi:hypothetical protein
MGIWRICRRCWKKVLVGSLCAALATEGADLWLLGKPGEEPKHVHVHSEMNTDPIPAQPPPMIAASGRIQSGPIMSPLVVNGRDTLPEVGRFTMVMHGPPPPSSPTPYRSPLVIYGTDMTPYRGSGVVMHGPPLSAPPTNRSGGA